jgi:hypothetical protein
MCVLHEKKSIPQLSFIVTKAIRLLINPIIGGLQTLLAVSFVAITDGYRTAGLTIRLRSFKIPAMSSKENSARRKNFSIVADP